ncbi:hypothetical protein MRB53_038969 [Persea americana]|nr:hypothetical protein MRB53_038969 [Persea americana]
MTLDPCLEINSRQTWYTDVAATTLYRSHRTRLNWSDIGVRVVDKASDLLSNITSTLTRDLARCSKSIRLSDDASKHVIDKQSSEYFAVLAATRDGLAFLWLIDDMQQQQQFEDRASFVPIPVLLSTSRTLQNRQITSSPHRAKYSLH